MRGRWRFSWQLGRLQGWPWLRRVAFARGQRVRWY